MIRSRNIVELTHLLIKDYLDENTVCVDMTLGNGNDTLFLAKNSKHVYAYEIQKQGIINSKKLLKNNNITNYTIFHGSHENVYKLNNKYEVAIFNLGYLPRSDKTITTNYKTTIKALNYLIENDTTKLIAIVVYRGHDNSLESNELLKYVSKLDTKFKISKFETLNINNNPPYLLLFERNKK